MIKYLRNKVVSVDRHTKNKLRVHGLLDDDLYGIELEVEFTLDTLDILKISGKWHRWTTPECPRALDHLNSVIGFRMGPDFQNNVKKTLGRSGCRHFANLLVEMGDAAQNASLVIQYECARQLSPDLTLESFYAEQSKEVKLSQEAKIKIEPKTQSASQITIVENVAQNDQQHQQSTKYFSMDVHVHTSPASPCSTIKTLQLLNDARHVGVNGVVLTDHNYVWSPENINDFRKKYDFSILRGVEITTSHGDILVYGYYEEIRGIIPLKELRKKVKNAGGFMAVAHPFRGFMIIGGNQLNISAKKAAKKEIFQYVDAIEVFNGKCTDDENKVAQEVADILGLKSIAGSDAHEFGSVGCHTTHFFEPVTNEFELLSQLHEGMFSV